MFYGIKVLLFLISTFVSLNADFELDGYIFHFTSPFPILVLFGAILLHFHIKSSIAHSVNNPFVPAL